MTGVPDPSDRDRVTAILTLAATATEGPWFVRENDLIGGMCVMPSDVAPSSGVHEVADFSKPSDALFIAASRETVPWLARRLLEALDTIDKARELHQPNPNGHYCASCFYHQWPCPTWQALNGGNE